MPERLLVAIASVLLGCAGIACGSDARRPLQGDAAAGTGGSGGAAGAAGGSEAGAGRGGAAAGGGGSAAGAGGGGQIDAGDGGAADHAPMDAAPDVPACTPAMVGASCGTEMVCNAAGNCVACTAGIACTPANACRIGATLCTTGVAVCVVTGLQPNGTACGTNAVCVNGACNNDCVVSACTPSNPCHVGMLSCVTGAQLCHDTGTSVPDGRACGANQVCQSGNCVSGLARSSR